MSIGKCQGRRFMRPFSHIQGSQTLSRYGDRITTTLPSVLPAAPLQAPRGLHRFEPVDWTGSLPPGAVSSTRQGISLDLVAPRYVAAGAGHFCRPLHVAMQSGLYLRTDLGRSDRLALSL